MGYGKKVWIFPDAELPPVGINLIPSRESMNRNKGNKDAYIKVTLAVMQESDIPVVVQYGRTEPRAVTFYTNPGYCEL